LDNLTHSLVGAALAQAAVPDQTNRPQRRLFLAAGVVAANLPDLDLVYVGITPPPLGYLLHHRGHTHTLLGLLVQGLLLAGLLMAVPWVRGTLGAARGRLLALVSAGLLTHILLDAGNSYGVHPFHPFDARWYYGDAVFILEPWLWMLVGVPVGLNAGRIGRGAVLALVGVLPALMTLAGVVRGGPLVVLAAAGVALGWCLRGTAPRRRAAAALAAATAFVGVLFVLSAAAEARTRAYLAPAVRGELVDVVLNPNPADPVCWMAIAVEKDELAGEYVLHRGTVSLVPAWRPPDGCASHRFGRGGGTYSAAWGSPRRESLSRLRGLAAQDCAVRAWLQFGRAPAFRDGEIYDLRFDDGARGNFTAMRLGPAPAGCPPHLTSWAPPRADLLEADPAR
jgi:inner membrane protein